MIFQSDLRSESGELLARVRVLKNPRFDCLPVQVVGETECRVMLESLRTLPAQAVHVSVFYPSLNRTVILNDTCNQIKKAYDMNLDLVYGKKPTEEKEQLPERMLAPLPQTVPEDGVLTFVTVETMADVISAPKHAILLFGEHSLELLEVCVAHPRIVGFNPFVLSGLPSANYSAQFESKTYPLERVAYVQLVNDVIERRRTESAVRDEKETPYEKERRQFVRADGSTKELRGVRIAGRPDETDDSQIPD